MRDRSETVGPYQSGPPAASHRGTSSECLRSIGDAKAKRERFYRKMHAGRPLPRFHAGLPGRGNPLYTLRDYRHGDRNPGRNPAADFRSLFHNQNARARFGFISCRGVSAANQLRASLPDQTAAGYNIHPLYTGRQRLNHFRNRNPLPDVTFPSPSPPEGKRQSVLGGKSIHQHGI